MSQVKLCRYLASHMSNKICVSSGVLPYEDVDGLGRVGTCSL